MARDLPCCYIEGFPPSAEKGRENYQTQDAITQVTMS